jgi:hypothetical protein
VAYGDFSGDSVSSSTFVAYGDSSAGSSRVSVAYAVSFAVSPVPVLDTACQMATMRHTMAATSKMPQQQLRKNCRLTGGRARTICPTLINASKAKLTTARMDAVPLTRISRMMATTRPARYANSAATYGTSAAYRKTELISLPP